MIIILNRNVSTTTYLMTWLISMLTMVQNDHLVDVSELTLFTWLYAHAYNKHNYIISGIVSILISQIISIVTIIKCLY